MMMILSIIVCTYNRDFLLEKCLKSIANQDYDKSKFEVIVVDNNSTDNTKNVILPFLNNPRFKYTLERNQGLSLARNKGLELAMGEYIAYLDDDTIIPEDWVSNCFELIKNIPSLDGFGGPLYPFYTTEKPKWFEDKFVIQMGTQSTPYLLKYGHSFIGANMVWKTDLLKSIDGFNIKLGYIGNNELLGEETDAYYRAWKLKPDAKFLLSPNLKIFHWVHPKSMKLLYRVNRYYKAGLTDYHINHFYMKKKKIMIMKNTFLRFLKGITKSIIKITNYNDFRKWVYWEFSPHFFYLGVICGCLGKNISDA